MKGLRIGLGIAVIVAAGTAIAYCVKHDILDDISHRMGLGI